jgi:AraC family transcriptional regulator of adaptative response / DNA-3-methyladenine glycosylase II
MRLLSENDLNGQSLEILASRLGVGSRHLRRLFIEQIGAPPKSLVQTQRLHIAMHLLKETNLPITRVCQSSGFASVRRFNDAIKKSFGMSPTEFRKKHGAAGRLTQRLPINIRLGYRPPYDWNLLVSYLDYRAIPGVESVHEGTYSRTISLGQTKGMLHIHNKPAAASIYARFELDQPVALAPAVQKVRDIADIDCRPDAVIDGLGEDPVIGPLIRNTEGVRVPGCWDIFELTLRAVFGQQISVSAATTMLGRLAAQFGSPLEKGQSADGLRFVFPAPEQLLGQDLRAIGLTKSRSQTVLTVAGVFAEDINFVHPAQPVEEAITRLKSIKGIGDWTAQYVALRALRSPDAFPAADLGLLKAAHADTPKELGQLADHWRPWRGYAALLLWHSLTSGTQA